MPDLRNDDAMAALYVKASAFAVQVLNSVLEDGDSGELLITLRQFTKAFGGVQAVAEKAELNPTQLYRTLSAAGNPTFNSLRAVLKAMGLQLRVERVKAEPSPSPELSQPAGADVSPVSAL
jgi:probable addiction module antidote protein